MKYVYVGKFNGTHGLRGEIKLKTNFEYIDKILEKGFSFYIGRDKFLEKLNTFRYHNGYYLVSFDNLGDIDLVKKYVNNNVYILRSDLSISGYVIEDLIGLTACFLDKDFGTISDVVDCGNGNRVFSISGSREILIPYNDNFIECVRDNKLYFKNVEGFVDED